MAQTVYRSPSVRSVLIVLALLALFDARASAQVASIAGAPEDVVLSGAIAQAFEGRQIRFHAAERSFRWLTDDGGSAVVCGVGVRAAMAVAVLERQGDTVRESFSPVGTLSIETDETGWHASVDDGEHHGADFASLATFLRHRRSST